MDEDLGASQWDDIPPRVVSPSAEPPIDDLNPFSPSGDAAAAPESTDAQDPESAAEPTTGPTEDSTPAAEIKQDKENGESDTPKKPLENPIAKLAAELTGAAPKEPISKTAASSGTYAAVPAAASRARALRMARSRKSSLPPGAPAPVDDGGLFSSKVTFEDLDPAVNPLGPIDDASPSTETPEEEAAAGGDANDVLIPKEFENERGLQSAKESAAMAAAVAADPSLMYVPMAVTDAYAASAPGSSTGMGAGRHQPIEQAAKPSFVISVGDPLKVGELTSAHTVYNVRTQTTSKAFKYNDFTVTRRYRDFRWLYHQLESNNPGVIVSAPPEKQQMGRFDENFVEGRRAALEKMLNRIASHPQLQNDPDLKLFLESDTLNTDIKLREKMGGASSEPAKSGGIFGALSFNGKFVETDEWFVDKKQYIDALEIQLRSLARALDTVIIQRKELADTTAEFAAALAYLGEVELSRPLSAAITGLAENEQRIRDLHERQGLQDMLTLGDTIDEYVRMIESIKNVFLQRQKSYLAWQSAEQDLAKKQQYIARALRSGKTAPERVSAMQEEASEHERKVYNLRVAYDDVCKTIKVEYERFQREKVEDFRASVETYLESAVESQKEAIELWETFYERQGFAETEQRQAEERQQQHAQTQSQMA
ncbi:Vps5 C terminal like-domain-containing protein [Myxozyma melibiosi]|uniref:Vps5 C terminal like-domain-containing protein n=1 Tax=Myxozyma melibiosi TaxID=54550 RepID=A0ABR1F2K0_9ASCO